MAEDLNIPFPDPASHADGFGRVSYGTRQGGIDANTRRMALIAAGLGGTLLLVVGVWSMLAPSHGGIPIVQADSRPLREKPINKGGLNVIGADEQALGPENDGHAVVAPAPEAPALEALRQADAPNPAPIAAAPLTPAPVTPAPLTPAPVTPAPVTPALIAAAPVTPAPVTPAPVAPAPATPAPILPAPVTAPRVAAAERPPAATPPIVRPVPQPPARVAVTAPAPTVLPAPTVPPAPPHPVARPTPRPAVGGHQVQLAAVASPEAAQAEWQRLARKYPQLLASRRLEVSRFDRDGHVFWRVRTGGFADAASASAFCSQVKAKGAACEVPRA